MVGNVAVHLMAGKYLETIWGSKEFLKFIGLINLASGVSSFFVLIGLFYLTGDEADWYVSRPSHSEFHSIHFATIIDQFERVQVPRYPVRGLWWRRVRLRRCIEAIAT